MKVIVSVSGGAAEVVHRPDDVEVVIVDFDDLCDEANTDTRIRAIRRLGEAVERLSRVGRVFDEDLEKIEATTAWLSGFGPMPRKEYRA